METMPICGCRLTRRQFLLFLVSSSLLVFFLVTFTWRSDGIENTELATRCAGDECNGGSIGSAVARRRRLQAARNSRGLLREKATLQRYELQQAGERL